MAEQVPLIEFDSEKPVLIKATPPEARELANRRIAARVDRLEARRRQQIKQEEQLRTEGKTVTQGAVVCGRLSEEERRALASNDLNKIREIARLRQKALRLSRQERWGDKVSTIEALARLKRLGG